jgi:hypothetical protein
MTLSILPVSPWKIGLSDEVGRIAEVIQPVRVKIVADTGQVFQGEPTGAAHRSAAHRSYAKKFWACWGERRYMASKLIELGDGTLVEIEVPENRAQPISGGAADKIKDATIDKIKPIILKACRPISEVWKDLDKDMHIEQAEVELGLGFEAEGNLYITKAKGNANLTVKFTLKPKSNSD